MMQEITMPIDRNQPDMLKIALRAITSLSEVYCRNKHLLDEKLVRNELEHRAISSVYYEDLHHNNRGYQNNNWLVEEIDDVLSKKFGSLIEVGCGNGKFLEKAAERVKKVVGVDWAEAPSISKIGGKINFIKADLFKDPIPGGDVLCSADVLEHIDPEHTRSTLSKIFECAPNQHHVIACYHDGHSHLTVAEPAVWLALFKEVSKEFYIRDVRPRKGNVNNLICVIKNY